MFLPGFYFIKSDPFYPLEDPDPQELRGNKLKIFLRPFSCDSFVIFSML